MISDTLYAAVAEIDDYLKSPVYQDTYTGSVRSELMQLQERMNEMRVRLDTPPQTSHKTRAQVSA